MLTRRVLCAAVVAAAALQALPKVARSDDPPLIAVFVSDAAAHTTAILHAFKAEMADATLMICDCSSEADAGAFIADNLRGVSVAAVFAVGDIALRVALREFNQTPVAWADALDNATAALHPHARGVSPRLDAAAVFARLKTLKPDLEAVGVLRSAADTDPYWEAVGSAASAAGLRLVAPPLGSATEVSNALKGLISAVHLTWIQPDPALWTGAVLASVFHEAAISHHPILGFDRAQLSGAQAAPLVAEIDADAMGKGAAALVRRLMAKTAPPELQRFAAPVLVGDLATLRQVGILINKRTAAAVDVWVQ